MLAGGVVVLVVLLLTLALPYLDQKRQIATAIPQPNPLFATALVELRGGQQACANEIDLLPGAQVAEFRVGTYSRPSASLLVTFLAHGYRERVPVPPTYVNNSLLSVPFRGPAKALEGDVCIANRSHEKIALYASEDRTKSRSTTIVNGRVSRANFDLAFYAAQPRNLVEDAETIMRRLRLFHAGVWLGLLWLLAVLFVIGVPLASVAVVAEHERR